MVKRKNIRLSQIVQFGLLFIFIALLFVGGPQLFDTRSFKNFWDLGHIAMFALLTAIIIRDSKWLNKKKLIVQFILIISFTIVLGALIEGIQLLIGRTSEFIDIWRSIVGSLIAFVFFKDYSNKNKIVVNIAKVFVLFLLLVAAWPLIKSVTDEIQAQIDFPVIGDFENAFELEKWYGHSYLSIDDEFVVHGNCSLKADLLTIKYSGISISYFPADWKQYSKLKFNVYNSDDESLQLTCRLHDKYHNNNYNDRFNKTFTFNPGWNEIAIKLEDIINAPADRLMDISEMKNFALFAINLPERKTIYFDYLRLE